jgi:predicted membrane channel-forming protein YqfA (hemolysin III family)
VIQRLQTVFLFLAAIINLFVFFTPIYSRAVQDPSGWIGTVFAIILTGAMVLCTLSIFFYKNRVKQLKWVKLATYFQVAVLAAASSILFTMGGFGSYLMQEALSVVLILVALIALWQAGRYIKKDQELVESMDRIR